MHANNSANTDTVNPSSDEFYRRYGLFELSATDTFVFNPMVLYQDSVDKKESINVKQGPKLSTSDNAVFRGRRTTAPRTSQNGSFKDKIVSTSPLSLSEEARPALPTSEEETFTKSSVILATFVRLLLIGHNILTVWRVTATYKDELYWLLLISNVLLIAEGLFTVCRRGGIDYKWWCPCFLIYLASTLPAIWLLQLKQYEIATGQSISGGRITTDSPDDVVTTPTVTATKTAISTAFNSFENFTTALVNDTTSSLSSFVNFTKAFTDNVTTTVVNITTASVNNATSDTDGTITSFHNTTLDVYTTLSITTQASSGQINAPSSEIWLIIVEESLIYLLVFSRWLLPRRDMSREFLADLLLEFLAIASDIMELLAVFDESQVRENLMLTYWVMAVWSASFIQFIPVLAQKRMFRHLRAPQRRLFTRFCGDSFVEIAYTCMSIFLQDGPFLVLRLFIMIQLKLITYSLVFFVLKNAVTVILLVYRLGIMCYRLPCCRGQKQKADDSEMKNIENSDNDLFKDSTESLDNKV